MDDIFDISTLYKYNTTVPPSVARAKFSEAVFKKKLFLLGCSMLD